MREFTSNLLLIWLLLLLTASTLFLGPYFVRAFAGFVCSAYQSLRNRLS